MTIVGRFWSPFGEPGGDIEDTSSVYTEYLHINEILKVRALGSDTSTDGGTSTFGTHGALLEVLCASL